VPKFEIGYWCRTRFSKQGYTTEAVRGIAAFAFEALGAKRMEIRCDLRNRPSARVAERAGSHLEGELRNDALGTDNTLRNTLVFSAIPPGPDAPPS
jgi:RimJ/RimL family protein N-acetyltransferase